MWALLACAARASAIMGEAKGDVQLHRRILEEGIQSLVFGEMNPFRPGFFADKNKASAYFDLPFGPIRDSIESLDGSGVNTYGLFTY